MSQFFCSFLEQFNYSVQVLIIHNFLFELSIKQYLDSSHEIGSKIMMSNQNSIKICSKRKLRILDFLMPNIPFFGV